MIDLAIDALAAYRLTKLVVDDDITAEPRDAVVRSAYESAGRADQHRQRHPEVDSYPGAWADSVANDPDPPKIATLVTCPWCSGMWVALGVVIARRIVPRAWSGLAKVLAFSAITGLLTIADG